MNEPRMVALPPEESPRSTGAIAVQSRELAETQTKYLMAERFPRDELKAIDRIRNAFSRPGLAERAAYEFARGGQAITGPSIHAAQAIATQWGNMEFGFRVLSVTMGMDGVPSSEVEAFAVDLQSRVRRPITFVVRHWRDTRQGGYALKDERDVYELTANMAQRRVRACILAVIPADVIDEAMEQAATTMTAKADTSAEAVNRMVEKFGEFGITRDMIQDLVQRRLDSITAAQVVRLRRVYQALKDGIAKPGDYFKAEAAPESEGSTAAVVAQHIKGRRTAAHAPPAPPRVDYLAKMQACTDHDTARLILDEAGTHAGSDEYKQVFDHFTRHFESQA